MLQSNMRQIVSALDHPLRSDTGLCLHTSQVKGLISKTFILIFPVPEPFSGTGLKMRD